MCVSLYHFVYPSPGAILACLCQTLIVYQGWDALATDPASSSYAASELASDKIGSLGDAGFESVGCVILSADDAS